MWRDLQLVRQPKDSKLCGQCCVAMVANISMEESVKAFGHWRGPTHWWQLSRALEKLGVAHSRWLKGPPIAWSKRCILKIVWPLVSRWKSHYVVWSYGSIWDSNDIKPRSADTWGPTARIVSRIEILI